MDSSNDDIADDTVPMGYSSKIHTRTQSLEKATVTPVPKRRTYRDSAFEHVSATAADVDATYYVESVGDIPSRFKSSM